MSSKMEIPNKANQINRFAIASIFITIVSIVSLILFGISAILVFGVGFGHIAIHQISNKGERGRNLAIISLLVCYAFASYALISSVYYLFSFVSQ